MATFEEVLAAENAADAKAEAAGLYEPGKQYHNPKNKVAQANDAELASDNQETADETNTNDEDGSTAEENQNIAVSYTHLTLPTILLV